MKNYDLFVLTEQLAQNIERLKALKGAKFTYGILKNIELLEKEVKSLVEVSKPAEAFLSYDKDRVDLCVKFCKKDENGELLKKDSGNGQAEYDIDINSEEWKDAITKLKETHSQALSDRDEQMKQYNELLDSELSIELNLISLNDVPNDISLDLMKIIKPFIKE